MAKQPLHPHADDDARHGRQTAKSDISIEKGPAAKNLHEQQQQQQQQNGDIKQKPEYDPNFTDQVIAATGPNANPRLARIMPSLVRHLHDFAREVDLTVEEWMAGVEMINEAGRMSDSKRNETGLLCDVLGLESLVDEITSKQQQQLLDPTTATATPSAILGPFYRANAPLLPSGSSILQRPHFSPPLSPSTPPPRTPPSSSSSPPPPNPLSAADAARAELYASCLPLLARISGRVASAATGEPVAGAALDVWQSAPNGLYEQQDARRQPDMNLRGRFVTAGSAAGAYSLVCLKPTAYPVPGDGPAGRLLALLDRRPFRPGHLHFVVSAPGFRTLTTQLYDRADPHVRADSVFAVKEGLLVDFAPIEGEEGGGNGEARNGDGDGGGVGGEEKGQEWEHKPRWCLEFDFSLVEL